MPLFRILGGSTTTPPSSDNGNAAPSSTSNSRYTYPGHRTSTVPRAVDGISYPGQHQHRSLGTTSLSSSGSDNINPASSIGPPSSLMMHATSLQHAPPLSGGAPTTMAAPLAAAAAAAPVLRGSYVPMSGAGVSSSSNSTTRTTAENVSSSAPPSVPAPPPPSTTTTTTAGHHQQPSNVANNNNNPTHITRPGAYQVTRVTQINAPAQVYRVTVPTGVRPGAEFTVHAGTRRVRVRCPPTSRPGQSLQITLPPETATHLMALRAAPLTSAVDDDDDDNDGGGGGGGGAVPMTPEVRKVNQDASTHGGAAQTFLVTIPPNIYPGMKFAVNLNGQKFMVKCPETAGPNQKVRILLPVRSEPEAAPTNQVFEIAVPAGVEPGQPFALMANGQRVLVTCPLGVVPGQKIRFQLPVSQVVGNISLQYESEESGWKRTIRVTDLKFQWVRLSDDKESAAVVDDSAHFDFAKAAYVRQITFLEGNDARMRCGRVELVPADQATVDSKLVASNNTTLLSYADIANVQGKPLEDKVSWFQNICAQLTSAWEDGHIKIVVRRKHLLLDSVDAIMALGRDDLRKRWRLEFLGEPGIDAGGVAREWFQLVTEQVFDPDFGLWLSSINNQACVNINPASGVSCPDDHLIYFRFLGRVLGRALFDRQLVKGHMVRTLYKHMLGWPITFEDIQAQDEEYYQSLKKLSKMDDVSLMCLDFTVTEESLGQRREVALMEGGAMKEVTNDNVAEYLEANLKYRLLDRIKPQLTELLLGFYDVVPEPALTVFDANELELILCGLPEIDMDDWVEHTKYSGLFEVRGKSETVVEWFWDIVRDDFDREMKARLLQFVTGTSGVPSRGFAVLQGIDGNIKRFTVHGVDRAQYPYPRAHTCFNRIDLPKYRSKKELLERLKASITMSGVGFDME